MDDDLRIYSLALRAVLDLSPEARAVAVAIFQALQRTRDRERQQRGRGLKILEGIVERLDEVASLDEVVRVDGLVNRLRLALQLLREEPVDGAHSHDNSEDVKDEPNKALLDVVGDDHQDHDDQQ